DRATAPGFRHLGNRYQPAGAGSGAPGGLSGPAPGWVDRRRDTSMAGTTAGWTVSGSQCAACPGVFHPAEHPGTGPGPDPGPGYHLLPEPAHLLPALAPSRA